MAYDEVGYRSLTEIRAFYHVSPTLFTPGTVLTPQTKKNFACSQHVVYLSDAPAPHYTVEEIARDYGWYVYRVEPLGQLRPGTCFDLTCSAATVREYLGTVADFRGSSKVVIRPSVTPSSATRAVSPKRLALIERALGTTVEVSREDMTHVGKIVFADYETFQVLVAGERCDFFASLKEVRVVSLRTELIGVVHGVRLNPWRYGSGWEGCELTRVDQAEKILGTVVPRVAA